MPCLCDLGPRAPFDATFWVGVGARGPNIIEKGEPLWKISHPCSYFLYIHIYTLIYDRFMINRSINGQIYSYADMFKSLFNFKKIWPSNT